MNGIREIAIHIACLLAIVLVSTSRAYSTEAQAGIVVRGTEGNCTAEQPGLLRGDILLSWRSADGGGAIQSPLDLNWLITEKAPRGALTLGGRHASQNRRWVLSEGCRRIAAEPALSQKSSSICRSYTKSGQMTRAAQCWQSLADKAKAKDSAQTAASSFLLAANAWSESKHWVEADADFRQAVAVARDLESRVISQLFLSWADSYARRGDLLQAESSYLLAARETQTDERSSLSAAEAFDRMGSMFFQHRDLPKATIYYTRALAIRSELAPESLVLARTYCSLGTVTRYPRNGDLEKADDYYNQALSIQKKLAPVSEDVASTLNNLGTIAWQRGNLSKAENFLHQALVIEKQLAISGLTLAETLNQLGNVSDLQGDAAQGEKYLHRALEIRQAAHPFSRDVAESDTDIASIAEEKGELDTAEIYQLRALEIDRNLNAGGLDIAGDLNNLAYIARDRGDLQKSEAYERQALEIEEKAGADTLYIAETLNTLGDLSRERADYSAAKTYYERSLAIRQNLAPGSADHAATLASLAWIARHEGQLDEAGELYEKALKALESQTARLSQSEQMRSDFRARHASYYSQYIDLLLQQNQPKLALQVLERSRARMLLEMMSAAHVDIRTGVDPALLEQERRLQTVLTAKMGARIRLLNSSHTDAQSMAAQSEVERVLAEQEKVREQIQERSPRYAALTQAASLSADEIQQRVLDPETLLLEYSLGPEKSHVWVVGTDSMAVYDLLNRDVIQTAAQKVYKLLTESNREVRGVTRSAKAARLARTRNQYEDAARALSEMILSPMAEHLGTKRLLIVGDGALQYVPFAALPEPGGGTQDKYVPLVVTHEIISSPSASVLALLRKEEMARDKPPKLVAVLADPVFDHNDLRVTRHSSPNGARSADRKDIGDFSASGESGYSSRLLRSVADVGTDRPSPSGKTQEPRLDRLWFTRIEAEKILAAVSPGQKLKAVDFKASLDTATSAELAQYRIVHFATHGLLDSVNPELSGLVFSMVNAHGDALNGFLDLQMIYNLNLPVDMVVLSACETGLGKEVDGEGLIGLTRGFMYAGASRVVASLWKVSDVATAQLMAWFYKGMLEEGLSPSAALRAAQLRMWRQKRWESPYYWAAFQIQGEWK